MRRTSLGSVPLPVANVRAAGGRRRRRYHYRSRARSRSVLLGVGVTLLVAAAVVAPAQSERTHRVAAGETLYRIAKDYGISVEVLQDANGISDPTRLRIGQELAIPQAHVVQPGDTIYSLSRKFQVDAAELLRANGITDPTLVDVGELLVIPEGDGRWGATASAVAARAVAAPAGTAPAGSASGAPGAAGSAPPAGSAVAAAARGSSDENRLWPLLGPRRALTGKLTGIVISGREGAAVRSVSSGTVRWASPSRGFGYVVLVQNPLGYIFGYLGNNETFVTVGERVEIGTEIGRLGLNPHDDQPNLYFVVFKDGRPVDPWLAPRV